jgi:hypothetical protein
MLEGGTKDEIRISKDALVKVVSTRFGLRFSLRIVEKSVENLDFILCSSFPNLRLGSIKLIKTKRIHYIGILCCVKGRAKDIFITVLKVATRL